VLGERSDRGAPRRRALQLDHLIIVLVIALGVPFVMPLCGAPPPPVVAITFDNPTDYAVQVEVGSEDQRDLLGTPEWSPAGLIAPLSVSLVDNVIDQGDIWLFRFVIGGEATGELRLRREELDASSWIVAIRAEVDGYSAQTGPIPDKGDEP
jgi:hypothetical protein